MEDGELLRRYAGEKSEEAFAELVGRHIDFVHAAALRLARGNGPLAQDVTQAVFTDLARKAGTLARHEVVVGWLHTATRFAVAKAIRTESRWQAREREALALNDSPHDSDGPVDWERLHPVLDAVLGELKERERAAILLRFFEKKPLAEVGAKLALSETAARSCVDRALEKMRALLARRGVTSTSAALGVVLANQAAAAAPAGLAASVTGAALASAAGVSGAAAWLAFFTMNKIKLGIVVALLLAALVPVLVELRANQALNSELKYVQAGGAEAEKENAQLMTALAKVGEKSAVPNEAGDLAKLRARAVLLRRRPEGVVEAQMRPPANAGFATPEAAFETMNWAITAGDWETLAKSWTFVGESKTAAEAFFAGLSPEAKQRYGTPERALAHGWLGGSNPTGNKWMVAMQVYDTQIIDGPAPMKVSIWQRQGNGNEFASEATFERAAGGGWVAGQPGVAKVLKILIPRLDPVSGELIPKQP